MLNHYERQSLRSLAMTIKPIAQIGKNGITETLLKELDEQLNNHEIIKISILKNSDENPNAIAEELASKLKAETVQVIGAKIVLYRFSIKDKVFHVI